MTNTGGPRTVVFRLEFGAGVGLGHLARCSALASALVELDFVCVLWTGSQPGEVPVDMIQPFSRIVPLGMAPPSCDWLVVDDYAFTDQALAELRPRFGTIAGPKMLVLDDEGKRRLRAADLVLNARLGLESSPYAEGVPTLLGERYALLRPGLARPESVSLPFPGDVEPVLVTMGGADPMGLASVALEALAAVDAIRFAPVVIRPSHLAGRRNLRAVLDRFAAGVWLEVLSASAFAGWVGRCRYGISAAGGTVYELAMLGLPFVGVVAADNQRFLAWEANRRWHVPIVEVGDGAREQIEAAFRSLVAKPDQISFSGIDARGAERVARAMIETPSR